MEAKRINKLLEASSNYVINFKLPDNVKNLSKKDKLIEIDKCIELLKQKGEWDNESTK